MRFLGPGHSSPRGDDSASGAAPFVVTSVAAPAPGRSVATGPVAGKTPRRAGCSGTTGQPLASYWTGASGAAGAGS